MWSFKDQFSLVKANIFTGENWVKCFGSLVLRGFILKQIREIISG